jgi:hypothetical protein
MLPTLKLKLPATLPDGENTHSPHSYFSLILTCHNESPITIVAEEIQNTHELLMVT